MKQLRTFIVVALALLVCDNAYGWGRLCHRTIAEIADDNGVSEHSVYCRLRFCGVQVPHKSYNTESIIQDLLDGVKQSEICKKYGVKRQWVSYCKKQYVEGRILNTQ